MASEAGKGDKRRPTDEQKYAANFDAIFRQKYNEVAKKQEDESVVKKQLDKQEKVWYNYMYIYIILLVIIFNIYIIYKYKE